MIISHPLEFVLVKSTSEENALIKVCLIDIVAFEAQRNYVLIHLAGRRIKTYMPISDVEERMASTSCFIRLHRGFIISLMHLKQIKRGQITMNNGLYFMVGDNYKDSLSALINSHVL